MSLETALSHHRRELSNRILSRRGGERTASKRLSIKVREYMRVILSDEALPPETREDALEIYRTVMHDIRQETDDSIPSMLAWLHQQRRDYALSRDESVQPLTLEVLDDHFWNNTEETFGIKRPVPWVAYQGWVARIIARSLWGISPMPGDMHPDDYDCFLDGRVHNDTDRETLAKQLQSGTEGIQIIPDFELGSLRNILSSRDFTMNQLIVTPEQLYCTDWARTDLKRGALVNAQSAQTFYGKNWYQGPKWEKVLSGASIFRGLKFLAESKAHYFDVKDYALSRKNLNLVWFDRQIALYSLRTARKADALNRLWRFAGILEEIGYLRNRDEFFAEMGGIQARYGITETPNTCKETDSIRECAWMMTKIITHRIDELLGRDPTEPSLPPEGYSAPGDVSVKRLTCELWNVLPSSQFSAAYSQFASY